MRLEPASNWSYAELAEIFTAGYGATSRPSRERWQRADESVANYEDVEALESEHGAVLCRRTGERVSLLQGVADDEAAARELLGDFPGEAKAVHWLNGTDDHPFNAALASQGGTLAWRQHEMLLAL